MSSDKKGKSSRAVPTSPPVPSSSPGQGTAKVAEATINLIATLVERFGWVGTLGIIAICFVLKYSTPEQKVAMIDQFVLGKGSHYGYALTCLGAVALLILQQHLHRIERRKLKEEISRLGDWKSKNQEERSEKSLEHAAGAQD